MKIVRFYPFPFDLIAEEETVILYGIGVVGQQYLAQLRARGIKIACCLDMKADLFEGKYWDIPVYEPTVIAHNKQFNNKKIIIAVANDKLVNNIKNDLADRGFPTDKILWRKPVPWPMPISQEPIRVVPMDLGNFSTEVYTSIQALHRELKIYKVHGTNLVRVGRENDGGYLMLDSLVGNIAYSYGISDDVSWEHDMAGRGYDIFMYDHTIDSLPYDNALFHWSKLGISDNGKTEGLLDTLEQQLAINGHSNSNGMVLKMDVEGAEWGFLDHISSKVLSQFDQIAFELHNLHDMDRLAQKLACLKKLAKTHAVVHIHANNCGNIILINGMPYPEVLEVTYVNRERFPLEEANPQLPHLHDSPCWDTLPDICLEKWNKGDYYGG